MVIEKATRERRFTARAVRIDSTVVESDIRYPSNAAQATDATRVLAREARKVKHLAGETARWVRDRSRSARKKLRPISRTVALAELHPLRRARLSHRRRRVTPRRVEPSERPLCERPSAPASWTSP